MRETLTVFFFGSLLLLTIYGVFKATGDSVAALFILLLLVLALNLLPPLLGSLNYRRRMNRRLAQSQAQRLRHQPYSRKPRWNNSSAHTAGAVPPLYGFSTASREADRRLSEAERTTVYSRSTASTPDVSRDSGSAG